MQKLIKAYRANPTLVNARKVSTYDKAHPMAACMLSYDDITTLAEAIQYANNES